jgi:hypothetical protein
VLPLVSISDRPERLVRLGNRWGFLDEVSIIVVVSVLGLRLMYQGVRSTTRKNSDRVQSKHSDKRPTLAPISARLVDEQGLADVGDFGDGAFQVKCL